jgi:DNA-binding SARP family transcriptional activator
MTGSGTPKTLRIRLLGGFEVSVGTARVPEDAFRLRKAKSLLKLLALAPERRMHRARMGELLWPERELARGRRTSRAASRARQPPARRRSAATALGIELRSEREPAAVVVEQIGQRSLLLVLDNAST